MMYVEWLRVRNCARVLACCLGVFLLIGLGLRIYFNKEVNFEGDFIKHVQLEPGTKVSESVLPDGIRRETIVSPSDQTTVIIDNLAGGEKRIVITEPLSKSDADFGRHTIGSVHIDQVRNGKNKITTINTNGSTPFIFYMVGADLMGLIVATLLATPFARENDGHLEFALLKPISRTANAAGIIGVDLAGIVLCSLMTIVALIIAQSMFEVPHIDFSGISTRAILMGFAVPFAWYAIINAATASMARGYGAVQGFAWPVALVVGALGTAPLGNTVLGQTIHNIFWLISRFSPLSYASFAITENHATGELVSTDPNFVIRFAIVLALFALYSVLAVVQWRRVEA